MHINSNVNDVIVMFDRTRQYVQGLKFYITLPLTDIHICLIKQKLGDYSFTCRLFYIIKKK